MRSLAPLAFRTTICPIVEIDVLDPEAHALHETHPGAVEEARHEPLGARKPLAQGPHLGAREHHGQPPRPLGPYELAERFERFLQYLPVEEHQGIERLILRAGRDIAAYG